MPNLHNDSEAAIKNTASAQSAFDKIAAYLRERGSASRKELELYLNLGTTRTSTLLKEMTDLGLVEKTGSGKLTRYMLK